MVTMNDRIVVAIDFVTNKATAGMKQISGATKQADTQMGKLKAGTGATFGLIKAQGPLVAAAAGAAFVKFGNDAVNAAASLQEQTNALIRTFGDAAPAILEISEAADQSMGLSQTQFNQAAVSFSGFVRAITKGGGTVTENLGDLMQRAADFGSRFELETSEAMRIFRSALAGEIEPIRKFGIGLNAAAVKAHALEKGILQVGQAFTEDMKIQARYSLLMEETASVAGDFAATSEDLVNSRKRLSAQWNNLVAQMGDELMPAFEAATNAANDLFEVLDAPIPGTSWLNSEPGNLNFISGLGRAANHLFDGLTLGMRHWDDGLRWVTGRTKLHGEIAIKTYEEVSQSALLVNDAIRRGMATTRGSTRAWRLQSDAIDETRSALQEMYAAEDARQEQQRAQADATLAAADANDAYIESIDAYKDSLEDAEATERDHAAALRDVVRNGRDYVEYALEAAGITEDQAGYTREWGAAMLEQASYLSGPLKQGMIDYISQVTGIPGTKLTNILAEVDPNNLDEVERRIGQELSNLNVPVKVEPRGLSEARADIERILGRRLTIPITGGRSGTDASPGGSGPGRTVRHSGGRVSKGRTYSVLPGETFTPDQPGRVTPEHQSGGSGPEPIQVTINTYGMDPEAAEAMIRRVLQQNRRRR